MGKLLSDECWECVESPVCNEPFGIEDCERFKPRFKCRWFIKNDEYATDCMSRGKIITDDMKNWNYCPYCKKKIILIESGA